MFGTLVDFANDLVKVLFLLIAAAVAAAYAYGFNTKKALNLFVMLTCFLVCATQLYFLITAAVSLPGASQSSSSPSLHSITYYASSQ
jgi:hypothetical protein